MTPSTTAPKQPVTAANPDNVLQLVTFMVADVLLGIDIKYVQEINRQLEVTRVPGAPEVIHGVVNLRGDVVTVIDPHRVFGLSGFEHPANCRNLVLRVGGERIGVMVDRVSDILTVNRGELSGRPSNVRSVDRRFIDAVHLSGDKIVVIVNPKNLVDAINESCQLASAVA